LRDILEDEARNSFGNPQQQQQQSQYTGVLSGGGVSFDPNTVEIIPHYIFSILIISLFFFSLSF